MPKGVYQRKPGPTAALEEELEAKMAEPIHEITGIDKNTGETTHASNCPGCLAEAEFNSSDIATQTGLLKLDQRGPEIEAPADPPQQVAPVDQGDAADVDSPASPPWGWWSVYDKQREWLDDVLRHIPWPDEKALPPIDQMTNVTASKLLQEFGGYLAYLNANQGLLIGRSHALKEVFEASMAATKGRLSGDYKTEAAKEQAALNDPDVGEALREAKRRHIEIEACILSQKGMIAAYERLWETVSRQITLSIGEARLATDRAS